ncbi:MAG: ribonuclease III [Deltaproteobacteria bacterium]|nr:ribonuclease III [Deltaproteobacteria bacterium]
MGYRFCDEAGLEQALTHRSRANEDGDPMRGNERLEFLGDAVLDLLVSELLMEKHAQVSEGTLSRARAGVVNTQALAAYARKVGLDQAVRLGRGEERSGGRRKPSILANVFEGVLGAIYLDGGLEPARIFVERECGEALAASDQPAADPKTQLQERMQASGEPVPGYRTTAAHGPDHAKEFHVEVSIGERVLGRGQGHSKREAEQQAARRALASLDA